VAEAGRGLGAGGQASGEVGLMAEVLDWGRVRLIRAELAGGTPVRVLAKRYGVSRTAIDKIRSGQTWRTAQESGMSRHTSLLWTASATRRS
jgi:hypothetical protein